jgi:hypothetical protein
MCDDRARRLKRRSDAVPLPLLRFEWWKPKILGRREALGDHLKGLAEEKLSTFLHFKNARNAPTNSIYGDSSVHFFYGA